MNLSTRQLGYLIAIAGVTGALYAFNTQNGVPILVVGAVALIVLFLIAGEAGAGGGGVPVSAVVDGVRLATNGQRPALPPGASTELARVYDELGQLADVRAKETSEHGTRDAELSAAERELEDAVRRMLEGVGARGLGGRDTSRLVRDMTSAIRGSATHVEQLTSSAESRAPRSSR